MKKLPLKFLLLLVLALPFISCSDDDELEEPMTNTLVEIAQNDARFSTLVSALIKADLVTTLNGNGPFTVFAPTNDAFDALFSDLGVSGISDLSAAQLTPILTYHVLAGTFRSSDLSTGYVPSISASGPDGNALDLYINTSSGVVLNGDVNVTSADVIGDNGIIHIVDKVITPPTVVDIAIANSDFMSLVNAVVQGGLVDALSATGPFTIFAPTDAAFAQLLTDLGVSSIADIDNQLLIDVLTYHVVPGNVRSSAIQSGMVSTLNTEADLMVAVSGASVTINGDVNVVATDIQGSNGVVHVIDKVLVPTSPTNTIVDIALGDANFSTLVAAVLKSGLAETLSGAGNFTVFAPTNAAFDALFSELGVTLDDLSAEQLQGILLYHALGSSVTSSQLSNMYVPTLNTNTPSGEGLSLLVNIDNGVFLNGNTKVTSPDITADNGVVHVIDKVLLPPTVVDAAIDNPAFTSLVSAVGTSNLVDALSAEGPFTVFAPTDAAFADLLTALGVGGIGEIDNDLLTNVLLYHVVSGNVLSTQLSSGTVGTLNPDAGLDIVVSGNMVTINGDVNVVLTDVQTTNGVIHVIDKVLLPPNPSNSIVDIAMGDENFSTLVQAVVKSGLAETLSGEGDFTVFAPTNAAFEALFTELGITFDDLSADQLRDIILYHALGSSVKSGQLSNTYVNTLNTNTPSGEGLSLLVNIDNNVFLNGNTEVTMADIEADNGVVHVINKVLLPPNIVDAAIDNPNFTSLVAAVVKADLVDALSAEGPFTVFAPTNAAFTDLLTILEVSSIDDIDNSVLVNTLLYHVVSGNVMESQLTSGDVGTLNQNNTISITIGDGVQLNTVVNVTFTDVQTTNGVIHVIDRVLLPTN
jgi:transforming growth factor-beta-induced protein